MALNESPKLF